MSRVCINEASPDTVVVDFHNAAWELAGRDKPYGFAFQKTAEHLGLESFWDEAKGFQRLYLGGTVESVKDHIPNLNRHIGIIAHTAARMETHFVQYTREHIGRSLGRLAQTDIPGLPDNASLMRTVGVIVYPFADAVSSDATEIFYARNPYWFGDNTPAVHEDGTPMRRYDARDIGGFVIGWDGLAVRESVQVGIRLSPEVRNELFVLAEAKGVRWPDQARAALRHFLDMPVKPEIAVASTADTRDEAGDNEDQNLKHVLSFPRTDIKELVETYQPPSGVTLADIFHFAVKSMLETAAADPELAARMEAVRQELIEASAWQAELLKGRA